MAALLGGREIFGKRKNTISVTDEGEFSSGFLLMKVGSANDDDVLDMLEWEWLEFDEELMQVKGMVSVNLVPDASAGVNSVTTGLPGKMMPKGGAAEFGGGAVMLLSQSLGHRFKCNTFIMVSMERINRY
eukprot:1096346_1